MMPLAATAAEVIKVAAAITMTRSVRVFTPRAIGVVGPRLRFFNLLGEPSLIWT
jgi:hypothetical protein